MEVQKYLFGSDGLSRENAGQRDGRLNIREMQPDKRSVMRVSEDDKKFPPKKEGEKIRVVRRREEKEPHLLFGSQINGLGCSNTGRNWRAVNRTHTHTHTDTHKSRMTFALCLALCVMSAGTTVSV